MKQIASIARKNRTGFFQYFIIGLFLFPLYVIGQSTLKLDNKVVTVGETLNYKASWGFFTIGSASTRIDKNLYRIGSNICYKINIDGRTNGLAKLFYVRDKWISFIDTASITTHKSYRSIREGSYELDEQIHFDHINKKAKVEVYDKKSKSFILKKNYDTPENIRDVVAGFMVFRLVDLSKYAKGETFNVNGFYEDEGYKIKVIFQGKESIKTAKGAVLCYKLTPVVPKNHVFDGKDAVTVWLSADKSKSIVRIKAKMFVGNVWIELEN